MNNEKKQALNPYLPGYEHVPDGEPYVFDDRIYVYGSHDRFGGEDFCLLNYVGWSAPVDDLGNWRYEGIIFDRRKDPFYKEGNCLFAPDLQRGPDGRYYLYYAFDIAGTIGVAVCDTPVGEFEYYGHVHYPDGTLLGQKGEPFQYDPGVLVDEDGRVYLYTGFCVDMERIPRFRGLVPNKKGAMCMELEPDMVTIRTPYRFIAPSSFNSEGTRYEGHAFFEASSMRKVGKKYIFIYSSEQSHELCYAFSDYPDRDFRYGGVIISNGDLGYKGQLTPLNYTGTNHGSIACINGSWYIFYQRQTGGSPYGRQGCAEPISINWDEEGNPVIAQALITSCGLNGKPLAGQGSYEAGLACCLMSGQGAVPYMARTHVDESHPYIWHAGGDLDAGEAVKYPEKIPPMIIRNMKNNATAGYRYFDLERTKTIDLVLKGSCGSVELTLKNEAGMMVTMTEQISEGMEGEETLHFTFSFDQPQEWKCSELWITYKGDSKINLIRLLLKK